MIHNKTDTLQLPVQMFRWSYKNIDLRVCNALDLKLFSFVHIPALDGLWLPNCLHVCWNHTEDMIRYQLCIKHAQLTHEKKKKKHRQRDREEGMSQWINEWNARFQRNLNCHSLFSLSFFNTRFLFALSSHVRATYTALTPSNLHAGADVAVRRCVLFSFAFRLSRTRKNKRLFLFSSIHESVLWATLT